MQRMLAKGKGIVQLISSLSYFVFVKNADNTFNIKGADLNNVVQGGQVYRAFPFSETSLFDLLPCSSFSPFILFQGALTFGRMTLSRMAHNIMTNVLTTFS
jgi:hypothetical protein